MIIEATFSLPAKGWFLRQKDGTYIKCYTTAIKEYFYTEEEVREFVKNNDDVITVLDILYIDEEE